MVLNKPISVDADMSIAGAALPWTFNLKSFHPHKLFFTGSFSYTISSKTHLQIISLVSFASRISGSIRLACSARDSETGKSALVNPTSSETEKEKLLWKEADERDKMRKKKKEKNREIEDRLNALLADGRIFCDMPALADRDSILIRDTCLENSFICQHPWSDFWSEGHLN